MLWRSEFRSIPAGYPRRGHLSFEQAFALQQEAEGLLVESEYTVDSLRVLGLVRESDCSACDCEFIALAISLETRLVTMNGRLLCAFPGVAVPLTTA